MIGRQIPNIDFYVSLDTTSLQAYAEKDKPTFSGTATFNGPILSYSSLTQVGTATFRDVITAKNDIQTNKITGKDGNSIEYKTTTTVGIHNFNVNGTQMTFINNLGLYNKFYFY